MHRILGLTLATIGVAMPAGAADWRLSSFFSQRFEADSNGDFEPDGTAPAFSAVTDVGLRAVGDTGTTTWVLAPGVRGILAAGQGADGLDTLQPRFNASVNHRAPRTRLDASIALTPQITGSSEEAAADQDARSSGRLLQQMNLTAGIAHDIDTDDRLSLNGFMLLRDFADDLFSVSPAVSWGLSSGYSRDFTPRTNGSITLAYRRFESPEDNGENGSSWEARFGGTHLATPRLSLTGSAGLSLTESSSNGAGAGASDDSSIGFVGGVNAIYRVAEDTTLTAGLNQNVEQTTLGEIESRLALTGSLTHSIDSQSRFSLTARAGAQNPLFDTTTGDRTTFSLSPSYSIDLNQDWRASIGYVLRTEDDDDGTAVSNIVFITLNSRFDFLP